MSTRSVIAFSKGNGKWEGRYHHSDGYPEGLGKFLFNSFNGYFNKDLKAMRKHLFEDHPAGFSCIIGTDFSLPAGYVEDPNQRYEKDKNGNTDWSKRIPHGPYCYCHGDRHEKTDLRTNEDEGTYDTEWLYVLEDVGYTTVMHISRPVYENDDYCKGRWEKVTTVELSEKEPNWETITCGDNFERCTHYAWAHFPELTGTSMTHLGTTKFLGREPLELGDAIAYEIKGNVFTRTGSGFSAVGRDGADVWVETLMMLKDVPYHGTIPPYLTRWESRYFTHQSKHSDHLEFGVIVSRFNSKGQKVPYRGVKPIYPPTVKEPIQLLAELRKKFTTDRPDVIEEAELTVSPMLHNSRLFKDEEKTPA